MATKELSYYRLRLEAYLKDYHPHMLGDEVFLEARSSMAAQTYQEVFETENNAEEAERQAIEVLLSGLHFSSYFLIEQIIENEVESVPQELISGLAMLLMKNEAVKQTIARYNPADDFDEKEAYQHLYTELTEVIAEVIKRNGLLDKLI